MNLQDSQLEERLLIEESELEMTTEAIAELDQDERPHAGTYTFYAIDNRNVAILSLLLDRTETAREHFAEMGAG
jgi:hypothetical protein